MKVLTFDIGQKMTGWAAGEPDMKRPNWGHLPIPDWTSDQDGYTFRFRNLARSLIETHKPDIIGYERPFIDPATVDVHFTECQFSLISQLWVLRHEMQVPRLFAVQPNVWQKAVTGHDSAPKHLGKKHHRREFWKEEAMKVCRDRNWFVVHQDEADACCILIYALTKLDKVFASRQGPLFRRAEMLADREAMTNR